MGLNEQKLQDLDTAISDLEKSSATIKSYSKIFGELTNLQSNVTNELDALKTTISSLKHLSAAIEKKIEEYKDTTIKLVVNASVGVEEKLNDFVKNLEKQINLALGQLGKVSITIDEQTTQVKTLFREFDSSLVIRLDKHKSDINLDLRNEGAQIQRALETSISSTVNKLEINLLKEIEGQKRTIKMQTIIIVVLAIITLISVIVPYVKNF